jgi:hypothetical protein
MLKNYVELADKLEDCERIILRWGYDNMRQMSPLEMSMMLEALRSYSGPDNSQRNEP